MSATNYCAQALMNSLFGKTSNFGALASAPVLHVALFTVSPGETGGGTEVSGGSYARQSTVAADWAAATLADPSLVDNANAITFPTATASWGTVNSCALMDASTGGNVLWFGTLDTAKAIATDDTPSFAVGELNFTLD